MNNGVETSTQPDRSFDTDAHLASFPLTLGSEQTSRTEDKYDE
jgi:hypothetical protein